MRRLYILQYLLTIPIKLTYCVVIMNNIKQISRLMVFSEVVQQGSFTAAADKLGITKSAVSQQIKAFEAEMGICVLNRTTRGISTTALGKKLLSRCHILKDQVDLILKDIASAAESPKGRFAITLPHALENNVVMPAIEQLCLEYPKLEPEIFVSDQTLDLIDPVSYTHLTLPTIYSV